jgi:hypothetical protein
VRCILQDAGRFASTNRPASLRMCRQPRMTPRLLAESFPESQHDPQRATQGFGTWLSCCGLKTLARRLKCSFRGPFHGASPVQRCEGRYYTGTVGRGIASTRLAPDSRSAVTLEEPFARPGSIRVRRIGKGDQPGSNVGKVLPLPNCSSLTTESDSGTLARSKGVVA